ncbi:(d)CMP kinase [uncultured Allobaculum sp.]|uniref:(d)CMP kinase n=1 Tax=uncultured Allobaculum sp. TaxID=1187017 RepID=UPI0025883A11|nr:(d)CMP kinase [uncultured Allobaculum sp.]
MQKFNVALDGPSGAGKSSVADEIARIYDLIHLDTGAMYRALAWKLHAMQMEPKSSKELEDALSSIDLKVNPADQSISVNGENVSQIIRTPEVSRLASIYSALPEVRIRLVALQQEIARSKGYILDGRDICDVVLPDADVKIYLDAAPEARAKRRMLQNEEKGIEEPYEEVLAAIIERDARDKNRKEAPLRISKDARVLDSSSLNFQETVDVVCEWINQALSAQKAEAHA